MTAFKTIFSPKEFLSSYALRAYAAEFIASFFFLFVTIGVVCSFYGALAASVETVLPQIMDGTERIVDPAYQPETGGKYAFDTVMVLTIAFAFGMAIMVLVFSIAHISGGHINPAVSMAMIVFGEINPIRGLIHIIVQTLGATCDVAMVDALWPEQVTDAVAFGANGYDHELTSTAQAFFVEFFGTALLVFAIFCTAVHPKGSEFTYHNAPIAIRFAVFLAHVMMVPITSCGINPARSFASAAFKNNENNEHGIGAEGAQEDTTINVSDKHSKVRISDDNTVTHVRETTAANKDKPTETAAQIC